MSSDQNTASTDLIGHDVAGCPVVRQFSLTVQSGPDLGATYQSSTDHVRVGTHELCDFKLNDPTVSRFHCAIRLVGDGVEIRDLGSRNGTTVNRVRVVRGMLQSSEVLTLGRTQLRFDLDSTHVPLSVSQRSQFGALVGTSLAMRSTFHLLERAAQVDITVLLEGETGTGKELAAESIHLASRRSNGPMITVDCGSIPPALLESQLFGHERGAFTGAETARNGAFQDADGGTIFLDEIGELPTDLQPKLLRALESREVKRVGATTYSSIDVRIIAATNRNLHAEVNARRFRSDLFFRLAVMTIQLPPLRERPDDLPALIDAILDDLAASSSPEAATLRGVEIHAELAMHLWPGNVRELRNYVERCLAMGEFPSPEHAAPLAAITPGGGGGRTTFVQAKRQFERSYLEGLLRDSDGNMSAAARAAGIDRMYLYRLVRKHRLR